MSKILEGIQLTEKKKKPKPTSPEKWSRAKAKARSKFDVYPSAYANAYAAKEYKKMGGGWRMGESEGDGDRNPMAVAVRRRIINQNPQWVTKYGVDAIEYAIDEIVGEDWDGEVIYSDDVSAYIDQLGQYLRDRYGSREEMNDRQPFTEQGMAEGTQPDYMAGHCHVMALALKKLHPDWKIRAHIGWDEDAEDDNDYRIDHVYIVAPDGSAHDCRGKFNNEKELVGPDETRGIETQFIDYGFDDIKNDVNRGELKKFTKDDIAKAVKFGQSHLKQGVAEGVSNDMSVEDMIAYLRQHHDKNLHPDYLDHLTSTNSKFVLKNIPLNSIRTELAGLDRAKVEQYKQMDFSKAPPIVVGSDGNILDGYHRATVAKALGIPTIKAYVGVKGQQGVAEGSGFDQEAGIGIDGKSFKFKIRDLVALADNYPVTKIDPQQFSKQIAGRDEDSTQSMVRAEKADLQYPIIVVKRQNGQLWIADGTHRAHKAILNKLPSINAKIIPIKDMAPFNVEKGVAEGSNDTNDYYADYYTDLLSQVRNLSWTDRATTRDKVKRDLDSGRVKLADLKMHIRDLDREISGKKSVSEELDPFRLERLDPQTRRVLQRMADHEEPGSWLSAEEAYAMQLGLKNKIRDPRIWEQEIQRYVDLWKKMAGIKE